MNTLQSKNNKTARSEKHLSNCCLIGEGSLLIKCAELLLQQKYQIKAIVSPDLIVKRWADCNNIVNLKNRKELFELLRREKRDYLFSIVNHAILPPEIINLVGLAITM